MIPYHTTQACNWQLLQFVIGSEPKGLVRWIEFQSNAKESRFHRNAHPIDTF